jgi:hypothetical protein
MRRTRPLQTVEVEVDPGVTVVAPTAAEALRVKAYLVVQRNVVRDYRDVVALSEHLGRDAAVEVLTDIDAFERHLRARERDGVRELFRMAIDRAREDMEQAERAEVASRVRAAVARSGMTRARFAEEVGTSASRLRTYLSGKVTPSAAMLVRIERVVSHE